MRCSRQLPGSAITPAATDDTAYSQKSYFAWGRTVGFSQIDGFVAQCRNTLAQDPSDGTIFLFINRARTMIWALSYDGTGYWLMTKRLSRGKFTGWPTGHEPLSPASAQQLRLLISDGKFSPMGQPTPSDPHATPLACSAPSTTLCPNPVTPSVFHSPLP